MQFPKIYSVKALFSKDFWQNALEKAGEFLRPTWAKVVVGTVLISNIAGFWRYSYETEKAKKIPVGFSEIENTQKEFKRKGKSVPPETFYYSATNDVPMKVFESHNEAYERNDDPRTFADELRSRVIPSEKIWRTITTYTDTLSAVGGDVLKSLDNLVRAAEDIPEMRDAFQRAWDDTHVDISREVEDPPTITTNPDGTTTSTPNSHLEYEYTIHTYDYDPEEGRKAALLLWEFTQKYSNLSITENLIPAKEVHADNESAIWDSHRIVKEKKDLTPEEYLNVANTWATGSTLMVESPVITSNYQPLAPLSEAWANALITAKSTSYNTGSSSDAGPQEFQVAEEIKHRADSIYQAAKKIIDGIAFTREQATILDHKIKNFVEHAWDGDKKFNIRMRNEIIDLATDMYTKNFEKGLDVQPFKAWMVVLFSVLGAAAGGGVGYGADRLVERYRQKKPGFSPRA